MAAAGGAGASDDTADESLKILEIGDGRLFHGEKVVDVFFSGSIYPGERSTGLRQLQSLRQRGYRIDIAEQRLPLEEYMRRCAQAWLVWSPAGRGWGCFRHLEAAATGSVPVITRPAIRPGEHCLYYDPGDGLTRTIEQALQNRERLAVMATAAREHVLTHLTHRAICRHMLKTVIGSPPIPHPQTG